MLVESLRTRARTAGEISCRGYLPLSTAAAGDRVARWARLAADAARKGPAVQARFAEAVEGMAGASRITIGGAKPSRGKRARARRERALQMLSELVGALVLAAPWPPPIPPFPTRFSRQPPAAPLTTRSGVREGAAWARQPPEGEMHVIL